MASRTGSVRISASLDYGREQDVGLTYAFEDDIVARLQHARYDSGAGAPEARVRKTWLTFTYAY